MIFTWTPAKSVSLWEILLRESLIQSLTCVHYISLDYIISRSWKHPVVFSPEPQSKMNHDEPQAFWAVYSGASGLYEPAPAPKLQRTPGLSPGGPESAGGPRRGPRPTAGVTATAALMFRKKPQNPRKVCVVQTRA